MHRALLRFTRDRRGLISGLLVAAALTIAVFALTGPLWSVQARGVAALLRFSGTPHAVEPAAGGGSGLFSGGATFVVPASQTQPPVAAAVAGIAAFVLATIAAVRWRRIPVPAKVLWLLFAVIGITTLAYTAFVSGAPPHPVNRLTLGFHRSGLVAVVAATLLFAFEVFPVPGPLRVKVSWLGVLTGFALTLAVVRMAVALGAVHHIGSWTFLYLHYLAGPMTDFLVVVAFYSLATHGLAKRMDGWSR